MPSNEQERIKAAQSGNLEAFNELVLAYQDRVYRLTYRIMGEGESAEDATQETFLTLYRRLETYRGENFAGWLLRIATNTCYDELRRRQRRPAIHLEEMAGAEFDDGPPIPDEETPTPEDVALQNDLQQAIQDCITSLGEDQRVVLVLSDVDGLSYQEIAEIAGVKVGTVKSRLSRARIGVRNCLQAVQELLPNAYRLYDTPDD